MGHSVSVATKTSMSWYSRRFLSASSLPPLVRFAAFHVTSLSPSCCWRVLRTVERSVVAFVVASRPWPSSLYLMWTLLAPAESAVVGVGVDEWVVVPMLPLLHRWDVAELSCLWLLVSVEILALLPISFGATL